MQTIYKKDSKGKVRQLSVYTEGADLIYLTGIVGGKLVEARKTCKGKNIGRSNETTPEQQALNEAESKITNEMSTGYYHTIEEAEASTVVLPMLAKTYEDVAKKIRWSQGVVAQRKLDGMRCLALHQNGEVILISRKGKVIDTLPHINAKLATVMKVGMILDGELYIHGKSFQANMSLIKKNQPGSEEVDLCIYDMVSDLPYQKRYSMMLTLIEGAPEPLTVLPFDVVFSEEAMKELHAKFVGEGYEGTMVKWGDFGYQFDKRSDGMLKYKDWIDLAIPIKDIVPAEQRPQWGVPVFHWPGAKKDELEANWKFDHAFREELLNNKQNYIGKTAEIRFFEYSETGVPRIPVMFGIREDK